MFLPKNVIIDLIYRDNHHLMDLKLGGWVDFDVSPIQLSYPAHSAKLASVQGFRQNREDNRIAKSS